MTTDPGITPAAIDDSDEQTAQAPAAPKKRARGIPFKFLIPAVIALDLLAVVLVPPFPKGGTAGEACGFPECFITSAIEYILMPLISTVMKPKEMAENARAGSP